MSCRALSIVWNYELNQVKDKYKSKVVLLKIADNCDDRGACKLSIESVAKSILMPVDEVNEIIMELYSHSIAMTFEGITYINLKLMEAGYEC